MNKDRTVRSTCRICYNSCGVLIRLKDGVPVAVQGDRSNPITKGRMCPKGEASLEYLDHPQRLKHPLRRSGPRGGGEWKRISWGEAFDEVAGGLSRARDAYGILSTVFIRGASKGLSDDLLARFANLFGSPNITSPAPYCFVPGARASQLTHGYYAFPDFAFRPRTILVWGANPAASDPVEYEEIREAAGNGSSLIVIDPLENELSRLAHIWIRPRPSTDLALALGFLHIIIDEKLFDRSFVEKWTVGFQELERHVRDYPPAKVEQITWVPADSIRAAARAYASERPGFIRWGNGIETNVNSFQTCRALSILRAVAGNLGVPGGEVQCGLPGGVVRGDPDFLCQNRVPPEVRSQRLSMGDGLLPINYYALPQTILRAVLEEDPYPVRAAYVQAGNILTSWINSQRVQEALEKLDFLAVADQFMTPTAAMADIVLPAPTYLEFDSVEQPWNYPIVSVQQKVAQVGECRPDGEILNELLKRVGLADHAWPSMHEALDLILKPSGISFEEFRSIGFFVGSKMYRQFDKCGFGTDSGKVELYSAALEKWGYDPLPAFREPPESMYSSPELAQEYPLIMTSKKSAVYRHSGGRQIPSLRAKRPEPILGIHPDTAAALDIDEGDLVSVATPRGRITQRARISGSLDPRVVEVDYAWWFPEKLPPENWMTANANMLTDDVGPYNPEMGSPSMRGIMCRVWKEKG